VILRKLRFAIQPIGLRKRIGLFQDFVNEAVRGLVRFVSWRIADIRKEPQALKCHSTLFFVVLSYF
jgi:hypothetical protein